MYDVQTDTLLTAALRDVSTLRLLTSLSDSIDLDASSWPSSEHVSTTLYRDASTQPLRGPMLLAGVQRRQRRRRALNAFFATPAAPQLDSANCTALVACNGRAVLRELVWRARCSLATVSATHATLMDLLVDQLCGRSLCACGGKKYGATQDCVHISQDEDGGLREAQEDVQGEHTAEWTLGEKLLYVVLRTSAVPLAQDLAGQRTDAPAAAAAATVVPCSACEEDDADAMGEWCGAAAARSAGRTTRARWLLTGSAAKLPAAAMPVTPLARLRCWLAPSIIALVEGSAAMGRQLRWSCDADPVVQATLCSDDERGRYGGHARGAWSCDVADPALDSPWRLSPSCADRRPSVTGVRRSHWQCWQDSSDGDKDATVRQLFARRGRSLSRHESMLRLSADVTAEMAAAHTVEDGATASGPCAPPFAFFAQHYPTALCDMVYIALHHCVIGAPDPYLLATLCPLHEGGAGHGRRTGNAPAMASSGDSYEFGGGSSSVKERKCSGGAMRLCLRVSEEFVHNSSAGATATTAKTDDLDATPRLASQTRKRRKGERAATRQADAPGATSRRGAMPHRGLVSMLQWACACGTRFLHLQQLVARAAAAECRATLGSYGRSALEALRGCLSLLRRRVLGLMQGRTGGAHGIDLNELLVAQRRLANVDACVRLLCDVFALCDAVGGEGEERGDDDDDIVAAALRRLSSATLLSSLHERLRVAQVCAACLPGHGTALAAMSSAASGRPAANHAIADEEDEAVQTMTTMATCAVDEPKSSQLGTVKRDIAAVDLLAVLFVAVLQPFHRMLYTWLTSGRLRDPFDEFFVIATDATDTAYRLDPSPLRLPSFLSVTAAQAILRAGLARRAVRLAATTLLSLTQNEQRRVEAELLLETATQEDETRQLCRDVAVLHDAVAEFLDCLPDGDAGQGQLLFTVATPCVSPLRPEGRVAHWRDYLQACNAVLLRATAAQAPIAEEGTAARAAASAVPMSEDGATSARTLDSELGSRLERSTLLGLRGSSDGVSLASPSLMSASAASVASHATAALYGLVSHEMQYFAVQPQAPAVQLHGDAGLPRTGSAAAATPGADSPASSARHLREVYEWRTLAQRRATRLVEWKAQRLALRVPRLQAVQSVVDELQEVYGAGGDAASARAVVRPLPASVSRLPGTFAVVLYPGGPRRRRKPRRASVSHFAAVSFAGSASGPQSASREGVTSTACDTRQAAARDDVDDDDGGVAVGADVGDERARGKTSVATGGAAGAASHRNSTPPTITTSLAASRVRTTATTPATTPQKEEDGETASAAAPQAVNLFAIADINDDAFLSRRVGPVRRGEYSDATKDALARLTRTEADVRRASVDNREYLDHCLAWARLAGAAETVGAKPLTARSKFDYGVAFAAEEEDGSGGDGVSDVGHSVWATDFCALCQPARPTMAPDTAHEDDDDADVLRPISAATAGNEASGATCSLSPPLLELAASQHKALHHCASYYNALGRTLAMFWGRKALQLLLLPPYGTLHRLLSQLHNVCLLQLPSLAARLTSDWCQLLLPAADAEAPAVVAAAPNVQGCVCQLNEVFAREWTVANATCDVRWVRDDECRAPTAAATEEGGAEADQAADAGVVSAEEAALRLLGCLRLRCTRSFAAGELVPARLIGVYGEVFCALVAWKVIDGLLARVWRVGLQCGVADVFFFCGAARQVLLSMQQYVWHSICALSAHFQARLAADCRNVHACCHPLEHFVHEHTQFVDACRWAALQGETWASSRRLLLALVVEVVDVARAVRLSNRVTYNELQDAYGRPGERGACPTTAPSASKRPGRHGGGGHAGVHARPTASATHPATTRLIAVTTRTRAELTHRGPARRLADDGDRNTTTAAANAATTAGATGRLHRRASTSHRTPMAPRHETQSYEEEERVAGTQTMMGRQRRFVRDVVRRRMRTFALHTSRLIEEMKAACDQGSAFSCNAPAEARCDVQLDVTDDQTCMAHNTTSMNWRRMQQDQRAGLDALIDNLSATVAFMDRAT